MYLTIPSNPGPHTTTQTELQLNHGQYMVDKRPNDGYFAVEPKKKHVSTVY